MASLARRLLSSTPIFPMSFFRRRRLHSRLLRTAWICDQPPSNIDDDTPNYQSRRARLIEQTLKPLGESVTVTYMLNGVPHVVRRSSVEGAVQMKIGREEFRPCSEEEVRTLLPIQAYSQKQLSDVSVRIDELTRFITAPIKGDLDRLDRKATDRANNMRETVSYTHLTLPTKA